ncbi:MAG: LacI family transcriptional regulator [Lachnospiraceae bacterium]|jgi:LacI family transcriptional regulator|nr:LacI family transcriptional regulator [Lachnospiraceae bacterium]MCI9014013.1 LacI family transcriptional regulator [Lachnospiraceae bacterium]MDE6994449.1 LacI family DNA-binding transcriptional regulator [Lachnospiraceae bacterium]
MEKVTMKDIADALNISRVTVSKAFNNQAGVSDALRETIFDKARELGYTKLPYQAQTGSQAPAAQEERTVALVVSRPESSFFWTGIIHRMAQELSEYNINLMYVYVPSTFTRDFVLPSVLFGSTLSGIAVVNVYDPVILGMVNDLPLPKVFLDTIPTLTDRKLNGDLLLIEGYRTEAEITESLILDGHKEIGFIGDINYAQTNKERYLGYRESMDRYKLPIRPEYCCIDSMGVFSYEKEIYAYLDGLSQWPTSFVCVSDYVAHFVQQYLSDHQQKLPHPVVLTGFDNTDEYTNVSGRITTANVPTGLLGKRMALQLLFRTNHPDAPDELTFIKPSIIK